MSAVECAVCGLAPMDLPDEVDPEMFFEYDDGVMHCPTCDPDFLCGEFVGLDLECVVP